MAFTVTTDATASRTVTSADDEAFIRFTNAAPTLDLENDATQSWSQGTVISGVCDAGPLTINPDTSVNINSSTDNIVVPQDMVFTLVNVDGVNEWTCSVHPAEGINRLTTTSTGSSFTPTVGLVQRFEYTANAAATINAPTGEVSGSAHEFVMYLIQDGTGSRTWTLNAAFVPAGGSAPTFSTAAGDIDIVACSTIDGGTEWLYWLVGSFAS